MILKYISCIYKERSLIIFGQNASKSDHSVPARIMPTSAQENATHMG